MTPETITRQKDSDAKTRTPSWFPLHGESVSAEDIRRPPRVVTGLILVMAAVMVIGWVLPAAGKRELTLVLGAYLFPQPGVLDPIRFYSLFTSWMVHEGIFHLIFNAFWIVAFGRTAHRHLGSVGFIVFFVLTSAFGSFFGLAAHWGQVTLLVGASAGAYGLIGAGAFVLTQGASVGRKIGAMIAYVAIFVALTLGFAMMGGEAFGVEGEISWQAHLGGLAAGLVLFPIMAALRSPRSRRDPSWPE